MHRIPRHLLAGIAAVTTLIVCASAQRGPQPGPWSRSKIPDGWVVHKTKNYEIQSQCGEEKAERLGDHMEALNMVYRKLFRPFKGGTKQQVIKLFKNEKAYRAYGGPAGSGAYYYRAEREMVCFDSGIWMDEENTSPTTGPKSEVQKRLEARRKIFELDTLGCAAHEGWHQYFSWLVVSMVELPSWLNEGMGDYFYAARPHAKPTRRNPAKLGLVNKMRLGVIRAAIRQNRWVPIPDLLSYSQAQYYSNPSVCYAEGWLLCNFLLHSGNKKYEEVIPTFIKLVKNDTNMDDVTAKAFDGIDLEKLDAEVLEYAATLRLPGDEPEEEKDGDGKKDGKKGSKKAQGDGE